MDASTVGDSTVTVAVQAAREQEPAILDSIYECGAEIPFKPFYDKANDYKYPVRREFTEALLQRTPGRIAAFAHRHSVDGNRDTEQVGTAPVPAPTPIKGHGRTGSTRWHSALIQQFSVRNDIPSPPRRSAQMAGEENRSILRTK